MVKASINVLLFTFYSKHPSCWSTGLSALPFLLHWHAEPVGQRSIPSSFVHAEPCHARPNSLITANTNTILPKPSLRSFQFIFHSYKDLSWWWLVVCSTTPTYLLSCQEISTAIIIHFSCSTHMYHDLSIVDSVDVYFEIIFYFAQS